jgi:para-aminobenzoate synthetase component I
MRCVRSSIAIDEFLCRGAFPRLNHRHVRSLIVESPFTASPELLLPALGDQPGTVLLYSGSPAGPNARYSFLATRPFLLFQSRGSRCEVWSARGRSTWFANPWHVLNDLLNRYEVRDEIDQPFPLGGAFGYWGYDLRHHVEPRLLDRHAPDPDLPQSHVGFHDSLVVFDHALHTAFIVATGLHLDGSRSLDTAQRQVAFWQEFLAHPLPTPTLPQVAPAPTTIPPSSLDETAFIEAVRSAQRHIHAGDIYQVNLAHRLEVSWPGEGSELFRRLLEVSPAPFAAYLDGGEFQLASSSPELFLRLSGRHVTTRPIKGTRPRSADPERDAQLAYELQTSPKELAELLMITDLLRNDLGRICDYGSIMVPDLARLEKFPQVQHLVATVEGRLQPQLSHLEALAQCFPGGSVTGAPKIRAMEIIDELEPIGRGPYTGALGYLGFNGESQLSIIIRTAVINAGRACFHTGAGIVADSVPEAEYAETLAKAGGFIRVVSTPAPPRRARARSPAPPFPARHRPA